MYRLDLQIPRMSEIEVSGFLSTFVASLIAGVFVKVASGPSKTTGLAKFQSNFTGLAVSFFWAVICVSQSRFFMKPSPASSPTLAKRLKGASRKLRKNHDVLCLNSAAARI